MPDTRSAHVSAETRHLMFIAAVAGWSGRTVVRHLLVLQGFLSRENLAKRQALGFHALLDLRVVVAFQNLRQHGISRLAC